MKNNIIMPFTLGLFLLFFSCKKDQHTASILKDIDGNVYKTVKIGNQVWMAENLRVTRLNDGTPISMVPQAGIWVDPNINEPMACYYDNKAENLEKYGILYNGYAVDTKKLAPQGWHVPTDADWEKLRDYLIANGYNYDGTREGNKIAKSLAANSGWADDSTTGNVGNDQQSNNKSGFNGIAAGGRTELGEYVYTGTEAVWWSSETANPQEMRYWFLDYNYSNLFVSSTDSKKLGISVRCVKD